MKNRYKSYLSIFVLFLITFAYGCSTGSDAESEVTISGEVINSSNGNVIADAIVEIISPAALRRTTTSDSLGIFTFTVQADSSIDITIEASRQGFNTNTNSFRITGGVDVTDLSLPLTSQNDGGGDGGGDQVGGEPEGAAAIILSSASTQAINIAETGDVVSAAFTFQVQDSAGRSLNLAKAVDVDFNILSGPGGGETVIPATARTNAQGNVTTSIFSGNTAGPVKLQAIVDRPEVGLTIRSNPVLLAIHGGFPDIDHFSIAPNKFNFEGYSINGNRNAITVIVGDQFSNPVKPGTVVSFNSTGGIIQGSGATDEDGSVTVDLISGEPRPNDNIAGSGGRPGYSTVTARTVNNNSVEIQKQVTIVFSTSSALISGTCVSAANCVNATTFDLPPNGGASFTYEVTDLNGNPMAAGTRISVEAGQGIEVTGDADFTLGNHLFPGQGSTQFSFSIRDTDDETNDPADLTLRIVVTSPNGEITNYSELSGTRRKVAGN